MPTLVVLAAGIGSRFGGAKQIQSVSDDGKIILDYTVYDAVKAGFDSAVFVIRQDMENDFKKLLDRRISHLVKTDIVFQPITVNGISRTKPLGTAHAILCCKDAVKSPFAVVNADDYYGCNAFEPVAKHLSRANDSEYVSVAYRLKNTTSENGTVSRGICTVSDGFLTDVCETANIGCDCAAQSGSERVRLSPDSLVSMNLWGFTPDVFGILQNNFEKFILTADLNKDEYQLPAVVASAISEKLATVKVCVTQDKWYGLTYREDLPAVKNALRDLEERGYYRGL